MVIVGLWAALSVADERRSAGVEITNVGTISCVTTDLPGNSKQFRCSASVSGRAHDFPEGTHFERSEAYLDAYAGAYGDLGIGFDGVGNGVTGNNGVEVLLFLEGAVDDTAQCVGGSVPARANFRLYRILADGAEEQFPDAMDTNVTIECR